MSSSPDKTTDASPAETTEEGWSDMIRTLFFAVLIAFGVRTLLYEPFTIPSASMLPDLQIGDFLFVSKYSYGYSRYSVPMGLPLFDGRVFRHAPKQGDVIVFRLPTDPSIDYIKRLIGLPGDHIQMKGGELYNNGVMVKREEVGQLDVQRGALGRRVHVTEYNETLPNGKQHLILKEGDNLPLNDTPEFVVPPGHYFFMGDNRDDSQDSRTLTVGYVPEENLVGKAQIIFFSLGGDTKFWQLWRWPQALRTDRLFKWIE